LRSALFLGAFVALGALAMFLATVGGDESVANGATSDLSGTVTIDGSSTVGPLSEAAAELFNEQYPNVRVSVGTSGTGGGFEKFCRGEIDLAGASRPIDEDEEEACERRGIGHEEVTVANDALTIVVNGANEYARCLSVSELQRAWAPRGAAARWGDVRRGFPDERLVRFGPGTDSGTFDYFTEAIHGEKGAQTRDYNNVGEDDNATVVGVQGTEGGMGYFGFSFFMENAGSLRALEIRNPETGRCVMPTAASVQDGSYAPLGRQLFVYPADVALRRPEVRAFARFYIENSDEITRRAGFIGLTDEQRDESLREVEQLVEGGS
jgi:phosphate transport system substrate-binding protein